MIKNLRVEQIIPNLRQPREYFDEDAMNELAKSIKRYGLIQHIEVRLMDPEDILDGEGKKHEKKYELVAGERRWRAHQLLSLTHIKANVINETAELERFKRSVSENLTREDMTPLEEARAFKRILDEEPGSTPESVAAEFGKSTQFVKLRLKLLDLVPAAAAQVDCGAIGTQAAVQIAALAPANQEAVLRKWAKGEFAGDNELVHFAYALKAQQDQTFALLVEDMSEEQREERRAERSAKRNALDRIERIRTLLDEVAKADPMKLAQALEGEVGARLAQLDRVADAVQKARFNLRQAKAHAEAREIVVSPEAAAESESESEEINEPGETVKVTAAIEEETAAGAEAATETQELEDAAETAEDNAEVRELVAA
jgi:ParB family chromosome partitioning protein